MNFYVEEGLSFYFVYDENTDTDYRFYKDGVLASAIRDGAFYPPTDTELGEAESELKIWIRRHHDFC